MQEWILFNKNVWLNIYIYIYPYLADTPRLFYYLCDLIVYEQFFRNDLMSDCLSEASCCSNASVFYEDTFFRLSKEEIKKWLIEKIVNGYTIRSTRNKITKYYFMSFAAVGIVISITRGKKCKLILYKILRKCSEL